MGEFSLKTNVVYGKEAINYLKTFADRKIFIVSDPYLVSSGQIELITRFFNDKGKTFIFSGVEPDPHMDLIIKAISDAIEFQPEVIIAVGGGSAIDTAKAVIQLSEKISGLKKPEFIAIPTTSGTGSEVTSFAVVTDRKNNIKYPLINDNMLPDTAILETGFLGTIPQKVIADTGMDVLTHAIEAYVSKDASDFSDVMAEKSIKIVFEYLLRSYENANDNEAREKMHNASCMAGIAFNNAGLGLNHALAHSIGGNFHISHGKLNSVLLCDVIDFNSSSAASRYAEIAKILGFKGANDALSIKRLKCEIKALQKKMKMPLTLCGCGIVQQELMAKKEDIIKGALADACLKSNPSEGTKEELESLFNKIASAVEKTSL